MARLLSGCPCSCPSILLGIPDVDNWAAARRARQRRGGPRRAGRYFGICCDAVGGIRGWQSWGSQKELRLRPSREEESEKKSLPGYGRTLADRDGFDINCSSLSNASSFRRSTWSHEVILVRIRTTIHSIPYTHTYTTSRANAV